MEYRFVRAIGFISLGAGVLLALTGLFMMPSFIASHFSPDGILEEATIQRVQLLRLLAVCIGTFATVFSGLVLVFASRVNRLASRLSDFISRLRRRFETGCPSTMNRFFDFVPRLRGRFQTRCFYLPFCFACALVALIFGLRNTQSGPGLSIDSVSSYMGSAQNLYDGNGFLVIWGTPYTAGGPLYPLLITGFMHLGFDAEQAARLIPILSFAFLMFPLFFLGKATNGVFTGYVVCIICLVFTPLLWVASYAWSEMPYILLSALAILFLVKFGEGNEAKSKILFMSALFTGLAILTRYVGAFVILVGLVVIVVKNKSRLKKMVYQALLFGSVSCIPITPWLYRNMTITSHLSGAPWRGDTAELLANVLANTGRTVTIVVKDFSAGLSPPQLGLFLNSYGYIVVAIVAVCCLLIYVKLRSTDRRILRDYLGKNYVAILYILIYFIALGVLMATMSGNPVDPRRICPVYPFLILVIISSIFHAYGQVRKSSLKLALFSAIAVFCVLFFTAQATSSLAFHQYAKLGQGYNQPAYRRDSQTISWVADNVPNNTTIYVNEPYVIWFTVRRPPGPSASLVHSLPVRKSQEGVDEFVERLIEEEPGAVIVCFKRGQIPWQLGESDHLGRGYQVVAGWGGSTGTEKLIGADDVAGRKVRAGLLQLSRFTAETTGSVTQFRVKSGAAGNVKVAIYADSGGSPGALLNANNTGQAVTAGWNTLSIAPTGVVSGSDFWLATISDTKGAVQYVRYYDAGYVAPGITKYEEVSYSGFDFPDPAGVGLLDVLADFPDAIIWRVPR